MFPPDLLFLVDAFRKGGRGGGKAKKKKTHIPFLGLQKAMAAFSHHLDYQNTVLRANVWELSSGRLLHAQAQMPEINYLSTADFEYKTEFGVCVVVIKMSLSFKAPFQVSPQAVDTT